MQEECKVDDKPDIEVETGNGLNSLPSSSDLKHEYDLRLTRSYLLRWFESKLFNIGFAISYLFGSKEKSVIYYLGHRMFTFPSDEVDFYLPQLIVLYINNDCVAEALKAYLEERCRNSVQTSLHVVWLLNSFCTDIPNSSSTIAVTTSSSSSSSAAAPSCHSNSKNKFKSPALCLRNKILSEEIRSNGRPIGVDNPSTVTATTVTTTLKHSSSFINSYTCPHLIVDEKSLHRTHSRSNSDAFVPNRAFRNVLTNMIQQQHQGGTMVTRKSSINSPFGDLSSGHAFDNGCLCFRDSLHTCQMCQNSGTFSNISIECRCGAPRIKPQYEFIRCLMNIGLRMQAAPSKEIKSQLLTSELSKVNLNLPARVWIPVHDKPHMILRIPPQAAVLLNSKDKAPYLIYVEIAECESIDNSPVPLKIGLNSSFNGSSNSLSSGNHEPSLQQQQQSSTAAYQHHHQPQQQQQQPQQTSQPPSPQSSQTTPQNEPDDISDNVTIRAESTIQCDELVMSQKTIRQTKSEENLAQINGEYELPKIAVESSDEDEIISKQFSAFNLYKLRRQTDSVSQFSQDSNASASENICITAGEIRKRLADSLKSAGGQSLPFSPDDPSASVLKEPWEQKVSRIRDSSPYGHLPTWKLVAAIIKCGDDLRQEMLAYQVLKKLEWIWKQERVQLWLKPYRILTTSPESGIIEPILNTISLHQVKKHCNSSLLDYFRKEFGDNKFATAQQHFVESCAAYCIVSYLIQVKDRHNGNILIDNQGHLIHIDFGFILSNSPRNLGFELSPFKLTQEFIDVMGGFDSDMFQYFKILILQGMIAVKKHSDQLLHLVEILITSSSMIGCFSNPASIISSLRERFHTSMTEDQLQQHVDKLVASSVNSLTTKIYDNFQYYTNGILS